VFVVDLGFILVEEEERNYIWKKDVGDRNLLAKATRSMHKEDITSMFVCLLVSLWKRKIRR